jgi:tetratricopeptide (TPR) repeat protein
MKRASIAALLSIAACRASLSEDQIRNHPAINLKLMKPEVVESSTPIEPVWVKRPEKNAAAFIAFTGQSFARTLDVAKVQAERDLLSAISNYVAVEVESEFKSVESHSSSGDQATEQQDVENKVHTHSSASIADVKVDRFYWEKVVASPLTPDNVSYRYWAHAAVSRAEVVRARLRKQAERQKQSGKRVVVLLPFGADLSEPGVDLSTAFLEEISRRLSDAPDLEVGDPELVMAVLGGGKLKGAEALAQIAEALLPDLVVSGGYQRHLDRIRVSYAVYDAKTERVAQSRSMEEKYEKLFELEDALVGALRKDLGAAAQERHTVIDAPADKALAAFELYHQAYDLYRTGKNEAALEKLGRAIELRPGYGEAFLRMGHVLERMGRYARIRPHSSGRVREEIEQRVGCTDAARDAYLSMKDKHGTEKKEVEDWHREDAGDADVVLSALVNRVMDDARLPEVDVPKEPIAAIDAYWRALEIGRRTKDRHLEIEATIALGDLAVRVDRPSHALGIHRALERWAKNAHDLHLLSLALFGQAVALRRLPGARDVMRAVAGRPEVIDLLRRALETRIVLGEKPYLVEIYNELGGLFVELAQHAAARAFYAKAMRIAKDIGNPYMAAVLTNNIGVLEYEAGHPSIAVEDFEQAYDELKQADEAEGQISAALNLGHLSAMHADFDRARDMMDEVERIVTRTAQEGRLAELNLHRGVIEAIAGDENALHHLVKSWALFRGLDRRRQVKRAANAISTVELEKTLAEPWGSESRRILDCIYGSLVGPRDWWHRYSDVGWDPNATDQLDLVRELNHDTVEGLLWSNAGESWGYR